MCLVNFFTQIPRGAKDLGLFMGKYPIPDANGRKIPPFKKKIEKISEKHLHYGR
jgi:hypothetical protein